MRDCPSFKNPPCVFHSNSLHFPFNFLSLCLSLSLLSSLSHAELQLRGHDCRLASRLIILFIPLSHSWLTNTKREDALPVLSAVKAEKISKEQKRRESVQYFQSVALAIPQLVSEAKSLTWSTQHKRNVPFRRHVTPFV